LLKGIGERFDVETWHKRKKGFVLPYLNVNAFAGSSEQKVESPHPQLYQQLKKLRDSISAKKDTPLYMVAASKSLEQMVSFLPQTPDELEQINGFGKTRVESYGQQFLEIIQQYCKDHNLSSRISELPPKKKRKEALNTGTRTVKPDTRAESFRLFKEGMTIGQIAQSRNLTSQTIEGHLGEYIEQGLIDISEILTPEKIEIIAPAIKDYKEGPITPIKEKLGDAITYGEIRLMIAWMSFKRSDQENQVHPVQ
jgi:ATP-dependent DNA helicase RecQ